MRIGRFVGPVLAFLVAAALGFPVLVLSPRIAQAQPPRTVGDLSRQVWSDAQTGKADAITESFRSLPEDSKNPALVGLRKSFASLDQNMAKREATRATKLQDVQKSLDAAMVEPTTPASLSLALKHAVALWMLSSDKDAVLLEPRVKGLIERAAGAAREAEAKGDWIPASELYVRLNTLLEERATYREDALRLTDRLAMLRLYDPQRFWELRKAQPRGPDEDPLPPFNGLGEDFRKKLQGIDDAMVLKTLTNAARLHVEHVPLKKMLVGGLRHVRTLITTTDLQGAFPGIADADARSRLLDYIDAKIADFQAPDADPGPRDAAVFLQSLERANNASVKLPETALLHEFGNGALGELDEFSALIWPDEVARFNRMTQGEFKGVGVQIQMDKETQLIKVVTPLEGTPAQRAGVHAGDLIVKIDGESAVGLSLNQAVDLITGPEGTNVTLTMRRGDKEIDFPLARAVIPLATIKGWRRSGVKEDQWDWFIDPENKIGYVRLLQFTETTTRDLKAAINEMKAQGLNGLILDLRFNPGGLLDQAVSVANAFIESGTIVSTTSTLSRPNLAHPDGLLVRDTPIVVLINEGSASASEIVSGAIRYYADHDKLRAMLVGGRSYGKGSVQNVWDLAANAKLKLTTQYYKLPGGQIIHRRPGASQWGVDPHLKVDMLPEQITDAIKLRQEADVLTIDESGQVVKDAPPPPDPQKLLTDGIDVQLQTALLLLQTQSVAHSAQHVRLD